jgi:quercetin dioxygenase-like cupin family protein
LSPCSIIANVIVFDVLQALILRPIDVPHGDRVMTLARIAKSDADKITTLPTTTAEENDMSTALPTIPPDDPKRNLTLAQPDNLPHIGLVGDTYTITVTGDQTAGRFCLIDMHIPPGGGPPPHRHDFEETFILLEGEVEATFRSKKSTVRAGETLHIPANAPHQFHNASAKPVRLLCICSPAGQEKFFMEVGVPVATRTTPPPKLDEKEQAAFIEKVKALAPKYRTELLREA